MTDNTSPPHADSVQQPSDDDLVNTWIFRTDLHNGELMPQLIDFARAILARFAEQMDPQVEYELDRAFKEGMAYEAKRLQAAEPSQSGSAGEAEILDVGFRYANNVHTPTVLIGFPADDFDARDRFIAALSRQAPAAPADAVVWQHAEPTVRDFTNELGNRIKITIEGPTSISENTLTPKEAKELQAALASSQAERPAVKEKP